MVFIKSMRADIYLVANGYAKSRTLAQKLILSGSVTIDGRSIIKPSEEISNEAHKILVTAIEEMKYVSRGGLKLEGAIKTFSIDVSGLVLADVGASTGGFTHCLLSHGAARVYAIDSGHGQLDRELLNNPQVRSMEGVNARYLTPTQLVEAEKLSSGMTQNPDGTTFDGLVDGLVMDVSFISQTLLHGVLSGILKQGGFMVTLIKPQFEVGPAGLGKHGIVKNQKYRDEAIKRVVMSATAHGFVLQNMLTSPIEGGDGNTEYLGYFLKKN